jgi:hypothetical protein
MHNRINAAATVFLTWSTSDEIEITSEIIGALRTLYNTLSPETAGKRLRAKMRRL